jgi:hypothetical protein
MKLVYYEIKIISKLAGEPDYYEIKIILQFGAPYILPTPGLIIIRHYAYLFFFTSLISSS